MIIQFEDLKNIKIPVIENRILHSFDENKRETIKLNGQWKKERFSIEDTDKELEKSRERVQILSEEMRAIVKRFRAGEGEIKNLPFPENEIKGTPLKNSVENYNHGVWYYKTFKVDGEVPKDSVIKFLSVNYLCHVWINNIYLGVHEGGFSAFSMNLGNILKEENEIILRVVNPAWGSSVKMIPGRAGTDYFNYTGVIQGIKLEVLKDGYIARTGIKNRELNGDFQLISLMDNLKIGKNYTYRLSISESKFNGDFKNPEFLKDSCVSALSGKEIFTAEEIVDLDSGRGMINLKSQIEKLQIWSIREPNLYIFKGELLEEGKVIDTTYTQYGFRTIEKEKDKLKINRKVAFLAGVARHEEWVDSGRTAEWNKIVKDMKLIEDLRATFVRTSHYPNHLDTYTILDRMGLVSMVEVPIWQHESENYMDRESRELALNMWRETTLNLENSPSIILWSTQNESNAEIERISYNAELVKDLRDNHDDNRLVTQSAAADRPNYWDKSMEPLDAAGWTMYFEIFYGKDAEKDTKDFLENAHKSWPDKPIINTEYGIWSSSGEDNQLQITERTLKAMLEYSSLTPEGEVKREKGYLAAVNYWAVFDWFCDHNKWVQTMGIYNMERTESKKVRDLIKKYYGTMTDQNNGLEK